MKKTTFNLVCFATFILLGFALMVFFGKSAKAYNSVGGNFSIGGNFATTNYIVARNANWLYDYDKTINMPITYTGAGSVTINLQIIAPSGQDVSWGQPGGGVYGSSSLPPTVTANSYNFSWMPMEYNRQGTWALNFSITGAATDFLTVHLYITGGRDGNSVQYSGTCNNTTYYQNEASVCNPYMLASMDLYLPTPASYRQSCSGKIQGGAEISTTDPGTYINPFTKERVASLWAFVERKLTNNDGSTANCQYAMLDKTNHGYKEKIFAPQTLPNYAGATARISVGAINLGIDTGFSESFYDIYRDLGPFQIEPYIQPQPTASMTGSNYCSGPNETIKKVDLNINTDNATTIVLKRMQYDYDIGSWSSWTTLGTWSDDSAPATYTDIISNFGTNFGIYYYYQLTAINTMGTSTKTTYATYGFNAQACYNLSIDPTNISFLTGSNNFQFHAYAEDQSGSNEVTTANSYQSSVTGNSQWYVENSNIGSISSPGLFTPASQVNQVETSRVCVRHTKTNLEKIACADVTINPVGPNLTLSADPGIIYPGDNDGTLACGSTLSWTSTGANSVLSSNFGASTVSGNTIVDPDTTTDYLITVSGAGGNASANATINVLPDPTVVLSADYAEINEGDSVTLTWLSQNAREVVSASGITTNGEVSGTFIASPNQTTTYNIVVTNKCGRTATASVTVNVIARSAPTVVLSASENLISPGSLVTLFWLSDGADYVEDTNIPGLSLGSIQVIGQVDITPTTSTTYYIKVGRNNSVLKSDTAYAYVEIEPDPTVSISADRLRVSAGDQITLSWVSNNAIGQSTTNFNETSTNGNKVVTITESTTFNITVSNRLGRSITQSITITVIPDATSTLRVNNSSSATVNIDYNSQPTISWSSEFATDCDVYINNNKTWGGASGDLGGGSFNQEKEVKLICTNELGRETSPKIILVKFNSPSGTIQAKRVSDPDSAFSSDLTVDYQSEIIIRWTTSNAETCSVSDPINSSQCNNSSDPLPFTANKEINLVAGNPSSTVATISSVRITVNDPPEPIINFSINGSSSTLQEINYDSSTNVHWDTQNVNNCQIKAYFNGSATADSSIQWQGKNFDTTSGAIKEPIRFNLACQSNYPDVYNEVLKEIQLKFVSPSIDIKVKKYLDPDSNYSDGQLSVYKGDKISLRWSSLNSSSCNISSLPPAGVNSNSLNENGITSGVLNTVGEYRFSATCYNPSYLSGIADSVIVRVELIPVPTSQLFINGSSTSLQEIDYNVPVTVSWSSANVDSCNLSPMGWSGKTNLGQSTSNIINNTDFSLTCSGPWGSTISQIRVIFKNPQVNIYAKEFYKSDDAYTRNTLIVDNGTDVVVRWSSNNARSCVVGQPIGSNSLFGTSGPINVYNTQYNFYINCENPSASEYNNINVNYKLIPDPTADLKVNGLDDSIVYVDYNKPVHLTWTSQNSQTCSLTENGNLFSQDLSGDKYSSNLKNKTTYTLTCGNSTDTINVEFNNPSINLTLNGQLVSSTVSAGSVVNVVWSSQNTASCNVGQPINSSELSGQWSQQINATQTFQVNCMNPSASAQSQITAFVQSQNSPVNLKVLFIAGKIILNRNSLSIEYDPRVVSYPPPGFSDIYNPTYKEIAP